MGEGKIVFQGKTKTGKEITIRYPLMSDVFKLLNFMNTVSKEQTFIRFQGEQLSLEEEEKYLKEYLEKIKNKLGVKLVAFIDEKFVGVADITMLPKVESHIGVFGIIVAEGFRGEGIGKLLMQNVINEGIKEIPQQKIIELSVFANNPVAINFYKEMGFREFGNLPEGILHKGKFVDHIYMYKKVG